MQIVEFGLSNPLTTFLNEAPFTYSAFPGIYTTASYWISIFGAPDESITNRTFIGGFSRGPFIFYTEVNSSALCIATEQSFYWDNDNQKLWFHIDAEANPYIDTFSYETYYLYNDDKLIYLDDQECLPLILSLPGITQRQDIVNYDKFSFVSGPIQLNNNGGLLDFLIALNLFGNNAFISYLDNVDITETAPGVYSASRSDVQRLQAFYIENYTPGISTFTISLQDKRKSQNIDICTDVYNADDYPDISDDYIDEPIAVAFGSIRELACIPVDGEAATDVTYRAALTMTDFGTVQLKINDTWTTKTPLSSNLTIGEFVIASADARDANGNVQECKLVSCEGIPNNHSGDVIEWLNNYYTGLLFNDTFYDTAEWAAECALLTEIGVVFNSAIKLFEAIALIQNKSYRGFRYEINAEGQRTIRVDDETRDVSAIVYNTDFEKYDLSASGDTSKVYSEIKIKYAESYESGKYISVTNDDYKTEVGENYRQLQTLTRETYLTNSTDAAAKAALDANIFRSCPYVVPLTLKTATRTDRERFLKLRIFDVLIVELTPSDFVDLDTEMITGREFLGIKAIKVLSISPSASLNQNRITAKIIPNYIYYI